MIFLAIDRAVIIIYFIPDRKDQDLDHT